MKKLLILTSLAAMLASIPTSTAIIANNALTNFKDIPKEVLKASDSDLFPNEIKAMNKTSLSLTKENKTIDGLTYTFFSVDLTNAIKDSQNRIVIKLPPLNSTEKDNSGETTIGGGFYKQYYGLQVMVNDNASDFVNFYSDNEYGKPYKENSEGELVQATKPTYTTSLGVGKPSLTLPLNDAGLSAEDYLLLDATKVHKLSVRIIAQTLGSNNIPISTFPELNDSQSKANVYINPDWKYKGIITDGQTVDVPVNVDSPLTIDQILANVSAQDLLGEEVQVNCSDTEKAKYNKDQIGTYKITISASDKYGQTATCYLNIKVIDIVAPVVNLAPNKSLNFDTGATLAFSELTNYFTITDNGTAHGGTIGNATFKLDNQALTTDKTFASSEIGNHTLSISVADSSGNVTNKDFTLKVLDTEAPVITRKDGGSGVIKIGLSRVLNLTQADFLDLFTATDNVDTTETLEGRLDIEGDFIPSRVGSYTVKVVVLDTAANKGSLDVNVSVDADLPPVFILSDVLVAATTSNPLSSEQIQKIIARRLYPDKNLEETDILISDATYQENATNPGSYNVSYSFKYTNENGTQESVSKVMTIQVSDAENKEEIEKELSGWDKFWQCFVNFFKGYGWHTDSEIKLQGIVSFYEKLSNWFKGIFNHFDFTCFISDEEYLIKYPENTNTENNSTSLDSSK